MHKKIVTHRYQDDLPWQNREKCARKILSSKSTEDKGHVWYKKKN